MLNEHAHTRKRNVTPNYTYLLTYLILTPSNEGYDAARCQNEHAHARKRNVPARVIGPQGAASDPRPELLPPGHSTEITAPSAETTDKSN